MKEFPVKSLRIQCGITQKGNLAGTEVQTSQI